MKNIFLMCVGLPGSGKSTWADIYKQYDDVHIASLDAIVMENAKEGQLYQEAWREARDSNLLGEYERVMNNRVVEHIAKFEQADAIFQPIIIWDQTNLSVETRAKKLKLFDPEKWERTAMVFWPSDEELDRRLAKREKEEGKTIPANVIQNMRKNYVQPTLDEGFDRIVLTRNW